MKTKREELHQESLSFILQNLDITTDLVPKHLLQDWVAKGEDDLAYPLQIFLIAYGAFLARKTNSSTIHMDEEESHNLFNKFQKALSFELLRRQGLLKIEKFKIFDFNRYNDDIKITVDTNNFAALEAIARLKTKK